MKNFGNIFISMLTFENAIHDLIVIRCYPKIDGTIYVYDPSCSMSEESCKSLSQELEAKVREDLKIKILDFKEFVHKGGLGVSD